MLAVFTLAALASPCRDPAAVAAALVALEPSPAECLEGAQLGPGGLRVVVRPDGTAVAEVDTRSGSASDCYAERVGALSLPAADCTLQLTWPMSVDAWPSRPQATPSVAGELDRVLAAAPALGGPSGHCPVAGQPAGRVYGGEWRPIGFSPSGAFAYAELSTHDVASPSWQVVVVSLVDDKVLGRVGRSYGHHEIVSVAAFLEVERAPVEALLKAHSVVPAAATVASFPAQVGEATLEVRVAEVGERDVWPRLRVEALRSDGGRKPIHEEVTRALAPLGLIRSPHEPRGAVLLVAHEPQVEATQTCRVRVVGVHLEGGFGG